MKPQTSGYYPFLDGLRAVAVLGVILFHYNLLAITGGYVGVDIFFVLSGFLITGVIATGLQNNNFTFAHFYERRCRRILPALFLVCALSVIAALVLMVPYDYKSFSKSLKGTSLFYSNMIFAKASGYFADPLSTRPLLHTWSLAVEEQFYLFFPPILFGIFRLFKGRIKAIIAAVTILFVLSLIANLVMIDHKPTKTFYILPTRAWELLTGSLVFLALRHVTLSRMTAEILSLLGALCIAACFAFYDRNTLFPGAAAILPCLGTALLIWPNLHQTTFTGRLLSTPPMILIGLISYGLYLFHWPVLVFARYYLDHELNVPEALAAVILTFAMSILSYRFVEMPIRSGQMLRTRKSVFRASAAGIALMLVVAIAGMKFNGFPHRFSKEVLQYANGNQDIQTWEKRVPSFENLNKDTALKIGNTNGAPQFLLWGDSHAEAIAPAADKRASELGITGLFVEYSGCLPLIGVARLDHAPKNAPCQSVGTKVLDLLKEYKIRNIILAGRWDDVFGWEPGSIELTRTEAVIAFTNHDGKQLKRGEALAPAIRETINTLTAMGVHVWVLEQVPPQMDDTPTSLAKALYFGRDPKALERPYADILKRRQPTNEAFQDFRNKAQVSFIDPANKLCPGHKTCMIADQGHSLYRDNNHLSVYGSFWIEDTLNPFFKTLRPGH